MDPVDIDKLSPSAINSWYGCPFKYKCHYLDKRPTIKTPDTISFGLSIHNIIENYYEKITTKTTIEDVPDIIEEAYTEFGNWATQARKKATRQTQISLLRFEKYRLKNDLGLPTFKEKRLYAKISDDLPQINGIIDVYFEKKGVVVDWKTGKWGELNDALKMQGKIYNLILEANGFNPKETFFEFLVLGKRVTLPRVSTAWVEEQMRSMMRQMKSGKFNKNKSVLCTKWCEYRLDCDLDEKCMWVSP